MPKLKNLQSEKCPGIVMESRAGTIARFLSREAITIARTDEEGNGASFTNIAMKNRLLNCPWPEIIDI
jgi:hypothetical protein